MRHCCRPEGSCNDGDSGGNAISCELGVGSSSTRGGRGGGRGGGRDGREKERETEKKRMVAGWLGWCCSSNGKKEGKERKGKEGEGEGEGGELASWRNASVSSVAAAGLSIGTLIS